MSGHVVASQTNSLPDDHDTNEILSGPLFYQISEGSNSEGKYAEIKLLLKMSLRAACL